MIRKSVETRDWLSTIEPRNVRAVMKRVVEDVTSIDAEVGSLYEEGSRKAHSSGRHFAIQVISQKPHPPGIPVWFLFCSCYPFDSTPGVYK